ncbi:hypothetical protein QA601_17160 [Chitinispirillales bacterium ANBcel5]|uniref:hypothetical protein n=1 Tax=Cellulosispirillum alkaliphilum TaxID=3039283 RepID=UPI002A5708FC|nr:hypothetical protein [Chitinispirillales bacterium ANBcel5]
MPKTLFKKASTEKETPAYPVQDEDVVTTLERLKAFKAQGIVTEDEFAQKATLLKFQKCPLGTT